MAAAKVRTKLLPMGITVIPIQPKMVGITLIMDEADPVSPSCDKSCRLELNGRIIKLMTEKGTKVRRNSQGETVPNKIIKTPVIVQIVKQTVASAFLLLSKRNLT